ncbi:DsbC family protein [Crenobacter caeni]|uniref:Thiol:disulfide interchange protein n=1 Tax=Crenobacter caeni TaxID=2705474 RepID=A0A6B2KNS9_9NEIS|nr:DsbC family protein [Crenobacter caeni]NDV11896.1 DsbC family protein [Crenobacter caeni]
MTPSRLLTTLLLTLPLLACSPSDAAPSADAVKKAFTARFPDREVVSVAPSPVAGLYEVVIRSKRGVEVNYQVIYSDKDSKHLVIGEIVDVVNQKSVTGERAEQLAKKAEGEREKINFAKLPLAKAIKDVRGDGSRKLVVFSDPDCPFCKRLEKDSIAKLGNVTVYTFLMPLSQLHPDAERKSRAVWCSADPAAAWTALMREGKQPQGDGKCDAPIAEVAQLAEQYGISGTPALVFESGELVAGAIPAEEIEKRLARK